MLKCVIIKFKSYNRLSLENISMVWQIKTNFNKKIGPIVGGCDIGQNVHGEKYIKNKKIHQYIFYF